MMRKKKNSFKKRNPLFTFWKVFFTLVGFGALSIGVLFLYEILLASPYFQLERVDVVGLMHLTKEEINSSVSSPMGTPLLKLDIDAIRKRVELNPWVRKATVLRIFPGTIRIELEERIPTVMVNLDKLYYIDDKGEIFKRVEPDDKLLFPVFTGIQKDSPALYGSHIRQGLRIIEMVKFLGDLSEIHIDLGKGFTLFTENGLTQIEMGSEDLPERAHRLKNVMEDLGRRDYFPAYINLNFKDMAVVRCLN